MGAASKTCSVILRLGELVSAAVVAGIVGRYLHYLSNAHAHAGSRILYAEVMAGISIVASLLLLPPLRYSFYCFGLDLALFVCWMVVFGLLCNLTVSGGCGSYWYWSSWGYYWGGYWNTIPRNSITQSVVGRGACSDWRATLAFSFIGGWCWLLSGILGIYVCTNYSGDGDRVATSKITRWRQKSEKTDREAAPNVETTAAAAGNQV